MINKKELEFYRDKRVLVTGHTGFKGSYMCKLLIMLGADVTGYSLEPPTNPALFNILKLSESMNSIIGDIRDLPKLQSLFNETKPEIVIHMAAQSIVRESYTNPVYTYDVNIMGTVNVLECVRNTPSVRSVINVTTDKVYLNREWEWGYREDEELKGYDPYSNSKSCSELVTYSYINSFFKDRDIAVSTCRAGNVIGGGDFAPDRIIPDCFRAVAKGEDIIVRNPYSTRPYQHVLEPVYVYLMIAMRQYADKSLAGNYNVGPDDADCYTTGDLVDLFCKKWEQRTGNKVNWVNQYDGGPHEANFLKLDCSKLKRTFGWKPMMNVEEAMDSIVIWYYTYYIFGNMNEVIKNDIMHFLDSFIII